MTGFIGSDRKGLARRLAASYDLPYVDLDQEILRQDGRSVVRIGRTMGEHEVRNKEYQILQQYQDRDGFVMACSDGILLDDQCSQLLSLGQVVIADSDLSPDALWEVAVSEADPVYAFLLWEDKDRARQQFMDLFQVRMPIYRRFTD